MNNRDRTLGGDRAHGGAGPIGLAIATLALAALGLAGAGASRAYAEEPAALLSSRANTPEIPTTVLEALDSAGDSPGVLEARAAYDKARVEAAAAGYRGDVSFSARPSWETSWVWGDAQDPYHEVTGTLETTVPTGLNDADHTRLRQALSRSAAAEAELREAVLEAVVTTYSVYAEAYLARAELAVLEDEAEAARLRSDAIEGRYARGEVSLLEVLSEREELRNAEQALDTGVMNAELALLDLIIESGAEIPSPSRPGALLDESPQLRSPLEFVSELKLPEHDTVLARIDHSHPRIVRQQALLEVAEADSSPRREPLLSSVSIGYSGQDGHGGAVSYSFRAPAVTLSYTPPRFELGSDPGASDSRRDRDDYETVSLSAVFSVSLGREREYAAETALAAASIEERRLAALHHTLVSEITAAERAVSNAESRHQLALQELERSEAAYAAAAARSTLGTAQPGEPESAAAALSRSRFAVTEREVTLALEKLRYLAAAHLPQSLPQRLQNTLFNEHNGGFR